jgi:ectoine hydroxylase-related dioxygenase (phytanoyl-CoA dioxygenase family)
MRTSLPRAKHLLACFGAWKAGRVRIAAAGERDRKADGGQVNAMASAPSLTPEQIAQYQRDGAILIKGVLRGAELELLAQGLEEARANPGERFTKVQSPAGEGETLLEMFPSQHCPSLRKVVASGTVAEVAGRLMRTPSAQLVLEQTFYKQKGYINPTPWHQDTPFLRVRGHDMARVWLSCDASPKALTVQVVRGSHRWNVVYDTATPDSDRVATAAEGAEFTFDGIGDDTLPVAPDVARYRDSFEILSWDVEPGDAVVFNGNVLHGADGAADHPNARRALATMWGGPDLRYHQPRGHAAPTLAELNGRSVPPGARIGDYEDVFTVGWRAPAGGTP